ncbi:ATP-binding protein [Phocaeicola sp.]
MTNTESQNIEFKENWRDEYLKWICGFANAQGGRLYVGIQDNGEVCGVPNVKKLMEDIPNKARDLMGILVDVNSLRHDNKEYIEIVIEAYPYPISYHGHYYLRSGATNQELKGAALDRFMLRKQGRTWDGVPVPYLKTEDLDNTTLDLFRKYAKQSGRMEEADLQDDNNGLIDKLRLIESGYLKRAAALLFHPDPERFVTGAFIKIGYFKEDANLIYQDEVHGNLFQQVKAAMDILTTKYLRAMISYKGIHRIETLPMPREALRETLLNSVVHKSYESLTPIQIGVYDDRLEVWNCGILPEGWTINNLLGKHRSRPYNPDIANVFFRAGEIEAWRRGIERIIAACKTDGYPAPEFQYDGGGLWTIFHFDENYQKTTQKTTQKEMTELTESQIAIVEYLKEHPQTTRKELAEQIPNITENGIKYNLGRLQELGILKRIGGRKLGYWIFVDKK